MHKRSLLAFAFAAAAAMLAAPAARAGSITWQVNTAAFANGGSANGRFETDAVTGTLTSWNIVVSGTNYFIDPESFEGYVLNATYAPSNSRAGLASNSWGDYIWFSQTDADGGDVSLYLTVPSLPDLFRPGTISLIPFNSNTQKGSKSTYTFARNGLQESIVSGSLTGTAVTPEPATSAMLAIGFVAAAGAARLRRRVAGAAPPPACR